MADEVDMAQTNIDTMLAEHIRNSRRPEAPKANGFCLFCEEPVDAGKRFCNEYCAEDYIKWRLP